MIYGHWNEEMITIRADRLRESEFDLCSTNTAATKSKYRAGRD
jgi:hypothetical protein